MCPFRERVIMPTEPGLLIPIMIVAGGVYMDFSKIFDDFSTFIDYIIDKYVRFSLKNSL